MDNTELEARTKKLLLRHHIQAILGHTECVKDLLRAEVPVYEDTNEMLMQVFAGIDEIEDRLVRIRQTQRTQ